jgi:MFS transporter, PAT family, beta-lactamase induction signal transducer AmpG
MGHNGPAKPPPLRVLRSRRMLISGFMGFSSGLPLLLTITLLQAWMKQERVDLTLIGLASLVGLPYTLKFLWSPILDLYTLPFLGRRRGWLLVTQLALVASVVGLGCTRPAENPWLVAVAALLVTFCSASQDIVIDAYRREDLADEELGTGSGFYVTGYRIGMLLASAGGLILADRMPFRTVYFVMAGCMSVGILTTLVAREPPTPEGRPRCLREAVIDPFLEYFRRTDAVWILAFILLYKLGDQMASTMTTPFYLDVGFSKTEIGAVAKLFGFLGISFGATVGGAAMLRLGINRALWVFGVLQAVAVMGFAALSRIGHSVPALAAVIGFENVAIGMGTAAYMAFMASLTNKRFTATQYALLSSLMGIPRVLVSAPTGFLAKQLGWFAYFTLCSLIAIPGLLLLRRFAPWRAPRSARE